MSDLNIRCITGKNLKPYINDLATLRIAIFKDYPYLYQGNIDYEYKYLCKYVNCEDSVVVLVLDEQKIVGASTAIPLKAELQEFKEPFLNNSYDVNEIFYFGESVLLHEYRGQNIYRHFFNEREKAARKHGSTTATFLAVERDVNDPRRPKAYIPLDDVWHHFGYRKHPELCTHFDWKEVGMQDETSHTLTFWLKQL